MQARRKRLDKKPSWKLGSFQEGRTLILAALAVLWLLSAGTAYAQAAGTTLNPDAPTSNAFVSPLEPTLAPTPTPTATATATWTPTPEPPTATPTPDLAAAAVQISPLPVPGALIRPPLDVGSWLWVSGSALLLLLGAVAMVVTQHRR
jgi:hypothetical protein